MSSDSLPSLEKGQAVALRDTIDMSFRNEYTGKKCQIKRTQIPISPSFAMTAHKSQGQTLTHAIIDFQSCSGTEAPYVMASRVKSLEGLLIARAFTKDKITSWPSQDIRCENNQLNVLRHHTIVSYGNQEEAKESLSFLASVLPQPMVEPEFESPVSECQEPQKLDTSACRLAFLQKWTERWSNVIEVGRVSTKWRRTTKKDCNSSPSKKHRT